MEFASVDAPLPHQTGVAKRSIGDDEGFALHRVIEKMMVGHLPDGVGARVVTDLNCHYHLIVSEMSIASGDESTWAGTSTRNSSGAT